MKIRRKTIKTRFKNPKQDISRCKEWTDAQANAGSDSYLSRFTWGLVLEVTRHG
jgi:hypothetical protein